MPRITKRQRILDYAAARGWDAIHEAEWHELRAALPDLPERVIRDAGLLIDPPWCGVNQHSFAELESSLNRLADVYGDRPDLRPYCRAEVIASKDHARLASRNTRVSESQRLVKAEMVEWMLVWLGDPSLFSTWARLRRRLR